MAMLAEPRRKQKFSVDPRNLNWSNDDSKFGHKMLEKMGWSKGKGLGATEQGNAQHISVQLKNDSRGVGCSKKYGDTWIAHQDDFNSLLASLNADHSTNDTATTDPQKVVSLEKSSRTTKNRVHYGKFTRGKDLSSRGADELDCIFGKKKNGEKPVQENTAIAVPPTDEGISNDQNLITSTQSVTDYFAKKMATLRCTRELQTKPNGIANNFEEERSDSMAKPELDCKDEIGINSELNVELCKVKKKKKKSKKSASNDAEEPTAVNSDEVVDVDNVETSKVKRKKKRKADESSVSVTIVAKKSKLSDDVANTNDKAVITESDDVVFADGKNEPTPLTEVVVKSAKKRRQKNHPEMNLSNNVDDLQLAEVKQPEAVELVRKTKRKHKKNRANGGRNNSLVDSASSSRQYVIIKKTGKKLYLDDLKLEDKFKGSNILKIKPYGLS